jgi:hypothetical protein
MRLYYMTKYETATKHILLEKRIRLSRFHRLNDPFELMSLKIEGSNAKNVARAIREHFTTGIGLLCMVQHWQSPLMWGHYAENHHGVCLGFDVPDEMPRKIIYTAERSTHVLDPTHPVGGITFDQMRDVMLTKSSGWAYEEEWRLFSDLKDADPTDGEFYIPFSKQLALREIIVGARCTASVGSFKKLLGHVDQSVIIIKARPAFETFAMVRQKNVTPLTAHPA